MPIETMTDEKGKLVRVDADVVRHVEAAQRPRESYNQALRRLLGIDQSAEETPAESRVS